MPTITSYDPFIPSNACVVDDRHVRIDRLVVDTPMGATVRFVKKFRACAEFDYSWFNTHEAELLLEFKRQRLSRVVQVAALNWSDQQNFDRVETLDAGPSLYHWLQLKPQVVEGVPGHHPFASPDSFFLIMRATLLALHEIHSRGFVHCDIDDRNLCLPFEVHPIQADLHTPSWNALRLIDFAFSLGSAYPLRVPLPVLPDAKLHSPAFMKALDADFKARSSRNVQKLDGRIDLFSLGAMAERLLSTMRQLWVPSPKTSQALATASLLVKDLKAQDFALGQPFDRQIHHELLRPVDAYLNDSGVASPAAFSVPGRSKRSASNTWQAARPAPHQTAAATPLAPIPAAATPLAPRSGQLQQSSPSKTRVAPNSAVVHPSGAAGSSGSNPLRGSQLPAAVLATTNSTSNSPAAGLTLSAPPAPGVWSGFWQTVGDGVLFERYRRAASKGDAEACFQVGRVLLRGKAVQLDAVAALQWFLAAAKQGHAAGQAAAASCYDIGHGTPRNDAEAAFWYSASANAGHSAGHYGIGTFLVQGRGVAPSDEQALTHFRAAAEAGMAEAYNAMGQLILVGRGTARSRVDAMECLRRAADLGHGPSARLLGMLNEHPEPGELPDPQSAKKWYSLAMKHGVADARLDLVRVQSTYPS